jgi:preprotein translocase subunit SecG
MYTILLGIQVLIAISIVVLVLVQHGEGADAGAAFGSGASVTVFGSHGSGNFLSRATGVLAALFFVISMALAYLVQHGGISTGGNSVVNQLKTPPAVTHQQKHHQKKTQSIPEPGAVKHHQPNVSSEPAQNNKPHHAANKGKAKVQGSNAANTGQSQGKAGGNNIPPAPPPGNGKGAPQQ